MIVLARTLRVHVYVTRPTGDLGGMTLTEPWTSQGCRQTVWSSRRYAVCKSRGRDAEKFALPNDLSCRFMEISIYTSS